MTNVGLHAPTAPPFTLALREGGATATNSRRPQSECRIEIGFLIQGNRGVIHPNHGDHIPNILSLSPHLILNLYLNYPFIHKLVYRAHCIITARYVPSHIIATIHLSVLEKTLV
jgi:hypothetical protein